MRTPNYWQRRGLISHLLLPLSYLYHAGFTLDAQMTAQHASPLPLMRIGNLTAGGAGKTPTAIALAKLLTAMGELPHIVSRGYGGKITHTHRVNPASDDAARVGDEPLLLAKVAPTWVGRSRIDSLKAARTEGATVALADDALQHHSLADGLRLLVVDLDYGFGNGRLLPAGPLRQPVHSFLRTMPPHLIVAIGQEDRHGLLARLEPFAPIFRARLVPSGDPSFLGQSSWLAFAGIAHPQKFFQGLREAGAEVAVCHSFADHHPYRAEEIAALRFEASSKGLRLITTAKDWVRLPPALRSDIAVMHVELRFDDQTALVAQLQLLLEAEKSRFAAT